MLWLTGISTLQTMYHCHHWPTNNATHHISHSMVQTARGSHVHSIYGLQTHRKFLLGKLGNTAHNWKYERDNTYVHHQWKVHASKQNNVHMNLQLIIKLPTHSDWVRPSSGGFLLNTCIFTSLSEYHHELTGHKNHCWQLKFVYSHNKMVASFPNDVHIMVFLKHLPLHWPTMANARYWRMSVMYMRYTECFSLPDCLWHSRQHHNCGVSNNATHSTTLSPAIQNTLYDACICKHQYTQVWRHINSSTIATWHFLTWFFMVKKEYTQNYQQSARCTMFPKSDVPYHR